MDKYTLIALLAISPTLYGDEDNYLTYIWQVNTWYNPAGQKVVVEKKLADLPPSGTQEAAQGIMGTSEFLLYAEDIHTGQDYLLDSTSASAYKQDAKLSVEGPAADPYNLNLRDGDIPRTQVGQGFTLSYTVNGLLEGAETESEAAKKLDFQRKTFKFGKHQNNPGQGQGPSSAFSGEITKNGHYEFKMNTAIPSENATETRGMETFSISSKDDYKTKGAALDTASINVWPISNGSFSGLKNGETYQNVPTVNVSLIDLYPGSDTYLEISSPVLEAPIIYSSRKNTDNVPISVDYKLKGLNETLEKDGTYIIRLLHISPFDTLEFDSVVIHVDRVFEIEGNINTSGQ